MAALLLLACVLHLHRQAYDNSARAGAALRPAALLPRSTHAQHSTCRNALRAAAGGGRRNTSRMCRRCRAARMRAAPRPRPAACARRCSCRFSTRRAAARAWRAGPAARAAPRPRRTGRSPCWSSRSRGPTRTACWACISGCATGSRCARRRPRPRRQYSKPAALAGGVRRRLGRRPSRVYSQPDKHQSGSQGCRRQRKGMA